MLTAKVKFEESSKILRIFKISTNLKMFENLRISQNMEISLNKFCQLCLSGSNIQYISSKIESRNRIRARMNLGNFRVFFSRDISSNYDHLTAEF